MTAPNPTLEAALKFAEDGLRVFPVNATKEPLTEHGFYDATTEPATIKRWWRKAPDANVAIATG